MSFGDVKAGAPQTEEVTVKNLGTKPITVNAEVISADGFTIDPTFTLPRTLAVVEEIDVPVILTIDALNLGSQTGKLRLLNDVTDKVLKVIDLRGNGIL